MMSQTDLHAAAVLVVDVLDEDAGLADVEDSLGRTYQLPAEWLPGVADGAAYRVTVHAGGVTFTPDPGGARALRERSKQTLLDFQDHTGSEDSERDPA
ncbi:hypothetical protein DEDE109153_05910 [Deinococcus deserti]|uniref:Uncharacterized protein n=1 Tax=Deinococcus deserti (strain DSM 17065 / CIP 109153 / LMG 22923 / VCD115) TaxID=546414 RepID=C1CYU4_DEIDV|nr:hypothetical protein [Deinococcus deserti]ACO47124.1 hypothetical protein Deide_20990 [Deinococcus deserti VCD115]